MLKHKHLLGLDGYPKDDIQTIITKMNKLDKILTTTLNREKMIEKIIN